MIPIIQTKQGKEIPLFLQKSLNPETEKIDLWAPLLFKAMVKSISPSYNQARGGYEPYALNCLTGAPYSTYDIVHTNVRAELTKRDQE